VTASSTATTTRSTTATTSSSPTTTRSSSPSASPASVCNIRTIVGTGGASSSGDGGQATSATLNAPHGVVSNGTVLWVSEDWGFRVRQVDLSSGRIKTVMGSGGSSGSFIGVAATSAGIGNIGHLFTLASGQLVVPVYTRCAFLVITPAEITASIAGTGTCLGAGGVASSNVLANETAFGNPRHGVPWRDSVFLLTHGDSRVRLVNLTTGLVNGTTVNAGGTSGFTGDGGPATLAQLSIPEMLALHGEDSLLIVDRGSHRVRIVNLVTMRIDAFAGTGTASSAGNGRFRLDASFNLPMSMIVLPDGSVLVGEASGCAVRRILPSGVVQAFAGTGACTTTGDGGSALSATLNSPKSLAFDNSTGTLTVWVAEWSAHRVSVPGGRCGQCAHTG